ncbi:MAG: PD40 domain-containing protein [Planctomycetes bacterium]|nr:PD40 domain-containing protein [Planctomycetota bacterium]
MRLFTPILSACALAALAVLVTHPTIAQDKRATPAQPDFTNARMLRYPDVSDSHICFVYAGDIWTVSKAGGNATRLSSALGEEYKPRFSPDGKSIAFSAQYDGNMDLYTLPIEGGVAHRVTHHPGADMMIDWTPDGKSLVYSSGATSPIGRYSELFTVSHTGGLPKKLALPWGDNGSFSPDGGSIAYTPWSQDFRTWKRYRGGMVGKLWKFDLKTLDAVEISRGNASYSSPMWSGDRIFYMCDDNPQARNNIYVFDVKTGKHTQITDFKHADVRFPSLGPAEIVFELDGALQLLDLNSLQTRAVQVKVTTDGATLRPRLVDASKSAVNGAISPNGERAAFEARGDVFTVPAEFGVTRNLTRSSESAQRYPAWSPDGKLVAYFSDRGGEYELSTQPAEGGAETVHTKLGAGYRYTPQWSPDSRKLVFIDQAMCIRMHDLESGNTIEVDKDLWRYHGELEDFRVSWSSDSRWFTYSRGIENSNEAIFIYDVVGKKSVQVTSGYYNDYGSAFDPDGKFLYFISGREFRPIYSDLDPTWIYANTSKILAVPLRANVKSPLAARNNEEKSKSDEPKKEETPKSKSVEIEVADFERRAIELPIPSGRYAQLQAIEGKILYLRLNRTGAAERGAQLVSFDLDEREEKVLEESADTFVVAANRKKLLFASRGAWTIRGTGGFSFGGGSRGSRGQTPPEDDFPKKDKTTLNLGDMQLTVDPAAEWRQIFTDAWRIERDFFYDPAMHGVDWAAMRKSYGALLDQCVTRWDVNYLLGEMISELNASHTYRGGGDEEAAKSLNVGMLGCDYTLDQGRYRISKIYDGAPWDSQTRSPLNESGIGIKSGEYLLAVNGVELDTSKDPWAAFQGLGGKTVALTLNSKPVLEGARVVYVTTMNSESQLRYLSGIEETRARVDKASNGEIGYIYVPDTGQRGQNELVRQFRAQYRKKALIIDERWNGGGQLPDRFVELLNRPILCYWGVRDGADWQTPMIAHNGPKAMLINGRAGSGGDAFPWFFKQAGAGKLIGTRTWGGLIGITGTPRLVDGGNVTAPTFGIYNPQGEWIIESYGVDPDIEVVAHPTKVAKGEDPEIDRAIEELKKELAAKPISVPAKPVYPNRSGK